MTDIENCYNWLHDAHAMEKQAEVISITATRRSENYPPLHTCFEQHPYETRRQLSSLQDIIARNHISQSTLQDAINRAATLGQLVGMILSDDEVIKVIIMTYVFAQFEVACYTALLTAVKRVGGHHVTHALGAVLAEERGIADWLLRYQLTITGQFLHRADLPGVRAGKQAAEEKLWLDATRSRSMLSRNGFLQN